VLDNHLTKPEEEVEVAEHKTAFLGAPKSGVPSKLNPVFPKHIE
jgi:hypothetical protein